MDIQVRPYRPEDIPEMTAIWNRVVTDGVAFPQLDTLSVREAEDFFAAQDFSAVAIKGRQVAGLYILHPNNIGRCGHLANASYAVDVSARGGGVGTALVSHSLETARSLGFRVLQFNAVVACNHPAIHLHQKLGFVPLGRIPGGFLMKDGNYEDILLFYHTL